MEGAVLSRKEGVVSLSLMDLMDLSVESLPLDALLRPIELLLDRGEASLVGEREIDGSRYIFSEVKSTKEQEIYELYVEPNTGIPKELRTSKETLQIQSFQIRDP